jgi:hypothetical protein
VVEVYKILLTGLLGFSSPVVLFFIHRWIEKKKKSHDPDFWVNINTSVEVELEELYNTINEGGERPLSVFVLEFDNGVTYFSGRPLQKFSVTNIFPPEQIGFAQKNQRQNISVFNNLFVALRRNTGWVVVDKLDETNETVQFFLKSAGAESAIFRWLIGASNRQYYGVLCVLFAEEIKIVEVEKVGQKAEIIYKLIEQNK